MLLYIQYIINNSINKYNIYYFVSIEYLLMSDTNASAKTSREIFTFDQIMKSDLEKYTQESGKTLLLVTFTEWQW